MSGRIAGLLLAGERGSLRSAAVPSVEATLEGFAGDKHTGPTRRADARAPWHPRGTIVWNDRQVSLVSAEELAVIAEALLLPEVRPEWLGANVVVEGVPAFTQLPPMTRLQCSGGVTLTVTAENHPCMGPGREIAAACGRDDALAKAFVKAAMRRRGLVAVVERAGTIAVGESLTLAAPR